MSNLRNKSWARTLLIVCALILGTSAGMAQVDTGTILGTVKDQTGAVIPDAKVTIVNQGTGESVSTTTRSDGTYIVTPLSTAPTNGKLIKWVAIDSLNPAAIVVDAQ